MDPVQFLDMPAVLFLCKVSVARGMAGRSRVVRVSCDSVVPNDLHLVRKRFDCLVSGTLE